MNRKDFIGNIFKGVGLAVIAPVIPSLIPPPHQLERISPISDDSDILELSLRIKRYLDGQGYKCNFYQIPDRPSGAPPAITRKLSVKWTPDFAEDLRACSCDPREEYLTVLVQRIAEEMINSPHMYHKDKEEFRILSFIKTAAVIDPDTFSVVNGLMVRYFPYQDFSCTKSCCVKHV